METLDDLNIAPGPSGLYSLKAIAARYPGIFCAPAPFLQRARLDVKPDEIITTCGRYGDTLAARRIAEAYLDLLQRKSMAPGGNLRARTMRRAPSGTPVYSINQLARMRGMTYDSLRERIMRQGYGYPKKGRAYSQSVFCPTVHGDRFAVKQGDGSYLWKPGILAAVGL